MSNELQANEVEDYRNQVAGAEWGDGEMPVDEEVVLNPVDDVVEAAGESQVEEVEDTGIDPAVQSMLDEMNSKMSNYDDIAYRLKQAENRVGSLQNAIQNQPKPQPAPAKPAVGSKEWATLKEDFPEWEEALDVIDKRLVGSTPDVNAIRGQMEASFDSRLNKLQTEFEVKLVGQKHPDFRKTIATDDYRNWMSAQGQEVKDKAASVRSEDAIEVLDKFYSRGESKAPTEKPGQVQTARSQRLSRSQTVKGTKPTRTKSVEDMTDTEYRAYLSRKT